MTAARYRASSTAIFAELGDGTGVILDLRTKAYFTLNATGVLVWKALAAGPVEIDHAAKELSTVFAVEVDRAKLDIDGLLRDLGAQELVERVSE